MTWWEWALVSLMGYITCGVIITPIAVTVEWYLDKTARNDTWTATALGWTFWLWPPVLAFGSLFLIGCCVYLTGKRIATLPIAVTRALAPAHIKIDGR